ncbi:unnamed protein product [Arabidopsis halleri]
MIQSSMSAGQVSFCASISYGGVRFLSSLWSILEIPRISCELNSEGGGRFGVAFGAFHREKF